ncbi:MAG: Rne/Rng family ribonuclease [Actinomycetota bacterium]|nr:Rne/Rng family ribonuclease [Actinomycetota bacterium]
MAQTTFDSGTTPAPRKRARKSAATAVPAEAETATLEPQAATPEPQAQAAGSSDAPARPARKSARKSAVRAAAAAAPAGTAERPDDTTASAKAPRKRAAKKSPPAEFTDAEYSAAHASAGTPTLAAPSVLFVPPSETKPPARARRGAKAPAGPPPVESLEPAPADADITVAEAAEDQTAEPDDVREAAVEEATGARRRRRRGRRGRGGATTGRAEDGEEDESTDAPETGTGEAPGPETSADDAPADAEDTDDNGKTSATRRRRRRRSAGGAGAEGTEDDPPNTVVHVRAPREKAEKADRDDDGVKGVKGSTRLEAKRQRRRDGRDTGRRRPPILTESEFLARREAVDRVMAVRQHGDRTQIAVLEDDILVEHYVTRASATSYVGNVYLGRVQNVLPSMEAAFVDIGKGRNGVLYAGEVNWDAAGLEGKSRAIEHALKSGDVVLVQVTKDPIGHKGARLTSQVSLPGRFLVYVPGGGMTGISRKLPDTERHRLKSIMKKIVPEDAGVIIRTAAEGASEEDLTHDVERLKTQWEKMSKKAEKTGSAPTLVHGEPDLAIRVVRDVFNEDFKKLIVQGDDAWKTVSDYIEGVAPDLAERSSRHTAETDLFHDLRVDEQLMKALDRKVYLPSGGSLVIDRTEAMTVIDVNTGKFIGSGGNLEQTVTRNNLEAAEEIVRQLRLRDVGGIVVIDFIDMVLESNRDLVLRRLTECLGRDRTKHQVAEVTSLGLVQMTRKRVGEGLLEAFSEQCTVCHGRGVILHTEPVDKAPSTGGEESDDDRPKSNRKRGGSKKPAEPAELEPEEHKEQRLAAIAAIHRAAHPEEEPTGAPDAVDRAVAATAVDLAAVAVEVELIDADLVDAAAVDADLVDADVVDADVVDAVAVPAEVVEAEPAGEAGSDAGLAAAVDAAPEAVAGPPAVVPEAVEADDTEPVQKRPAARRRRAASRPAGPPVAVGRR